MVWLKNFLINWSGLETRLLAALSRGFEIAHPGNVVSNLSQGDPTSSRTAVVSARSQCVLMSVVN